MPASDSASATAHYGLFNDSFPPVIDGVTLTVDNYLRWFVNKGRRVSLVTPHIPGAPQAEGYEKLTYFSLPIYNRHPYRYGYPLFDPGIWLSMRRRPFRLVHAHCPFSSGRLAHYAARHHGIPMVATFHSKYHTDLVRSLPGPMVTYQMRRIRDFFNDADALWIPQAGVEKTVREYGITAPVTVVENGNDFLDIDLGGSLADFRARARERAGIPRERLSLIFVGQHISHKGVFVIIDALAQLKDKLDFEMHFIGTGYASPRMAESIRSQGLEGRVAMHGAVADRRDLVDRYAAADLFLFPSFYDNAPLVVREAGAMGTPSLIPAGSTAAEHLRDGVNGFLSPDATAEAYAASLMALAANRPMLEKAGAEARTSLSRPWSDVMPEIEQRYQDIIARHGRR